MTDFEDAGHCLADIAGAAQRRRDLLFARDALVAERLDRPLAATATPIGAGRYATGRALLGVGGLAVGTGLEAAFRYDWFPHEAWGAWSAAERAELHFALSEDIRLPAKLRFEFCTLTVDGETRHGRLFLSGRLVAAAGFTHPGLVVGMDAEVTEADLSPGRELDLTVEVDSLVSPAAAMGAGDDRLLGLGLVRVSVVMPSTEVVRRKIAFHGRRVANLVRRVRLRFKERGLVHGGMHLCRAALRRLA
jgi:hypothetical protein